MPEPTATRSPAEIAELHRLAAAIAEEAGTFLLDAQPRLRTSVSTKSSPTDMVTEMDTAAELRIADVLQQRRPDDGLVGEEGTLVEGTTGIRWVVDPLDGTTNYLYEFPAFAVSVAAEDSDGPVAGAVFDPTHAELYSAGRGLGAFRNARPISVSGAATLATALVGTGFSYDPEQRRAQAEALAHVLPEIRDVRRAGAAALDLCWVACGRLDAFFERGLAQWDYAAGSLIVAEAGGWCGSFDGGPPTAGSVVAAAPHLRQPLLDLLAKAGA